MSWYGSLDSNKKLDTLIDTKPSLEQLFNFPDFIQQLKAYNPKLLDFLTNSSEITNQLIHYLTVPPQESDSKDRKHKLPMMAIQMIESQTVCVINSFLKIDPVRKLPYFLIMFEDLLGKGEVMPLLCGYFFKFNIAMFNSRYKEIIDFLYDQKNALLMLARHSYSPILMNCLQIYLNLDMTKNPIVISERLGLRVQIVKILFEAIKDEYNLYTKQSSSSLAERNQIVIENISEVLIEVVEKYYLITDGKNMLEAILSEENVDLIVKILMDGTAISHCVVNLIMWSLRYYSFSSFNTEERQNQEMSKKNMERLEQQPLIKKIIQIFPQLVSILSTATKVTIFHSKLIEILNMSLSLSSMKILQAVKTTKYIQTLLQMLFKFQQLSMIHKQIDKLFLSIFNNERLIYELYKHYLFCQADLIEVTAGRYLNSISNLEEYKRSINQVHEGYFGFLMKIIKIYSKIQTANEQINNSIMAKSVLWEKVSNNILKPYDLICFKELGTYDSIVEGVIPITQYSTKLFSAIRTEENDLKTKQMIQEINREQSIKNIKTMEDTTNSLQKSMLDKQINSEQQVKKDSLLKPEEDTLFNVNLNVSPEARSNDSAQMPISPRPEGRNGFKEYLEKHKVEAEKQIKLKRSESQERRLSAQKSRVTSPSPKRVNKWEEKPAQQSVDAEKVQLNKATSAENIASKKQKISITHANSKHPMLPPNNKKHQVDVQLNESTVSLDLNQTGSLNALTAKSNESSQIISKSTNLDCLKHIVIRKQRAEKPIKKDYRPVNSEDLTLLDYFGIKF